MSLVKLGQAVAAKFAAEGGIRNQTQLRRAPADPLAPECLPDPADKCRAARSLPCGEMAFAYPAAF
jgi:hypothetical protein